MSLRGGLGRRNWPWRWWSAAAACAVWACTPGCAQEERVIRYKPFFAGLSDAKFNTPPVADRTLPALPGAEVDPTASAGDGLPPTVVRKPDGSLELRSKTARQLMVNIIFTLDGPAADAVEVIAPGVEQETIDPLRPKRDWAAIFAQQVLSSTSREEYLSRGLDPREAHATLMQRRQDINMLFNRMPMGEYTPNVLMRKVAHKVYRVEITGRPGDGLPWRGFDMVMERANWRLRWFVD